MISRDSLNLIDFNRDGVLDVEYGRHYTRYIFDEKGHTKLPEVVFNDETHESCLGRSLRLRRKRLYSNVLGPRFSPYIYRFSKQFQKLVICDLDGREVHSYEILNSGSIL